jgi:hypothetical protein
MRQLKRFVLMKPAHIILFMAASLSRRMKWQLFDISAILRMWLLAVILMQLASSVSPIANIY